MRNTKWSRERCRCCDARPGARSLVAILVVFNLLGWVRADDWPQWRGPFRDGHWRETGLVDELPGGQLTILWSVKISGGYSGPTVSRGRVYVSDRMVHEDQQQTERVHCFNSRTGARLWSHEYSCPYVNVDHDAGPRGSVTLDDGRAYSLGAMGHFYCFDAVDGSILWHHDMNVKFKIRMPIWGISCSPLIEKDLVIVQVSGAGNACLVALDRRSGEERWRALEDQASYSSPLVIQQAGQRVLVCWTGQRLVGLDPHQGDLLWEHPLPPSKWIRGCASPVVEGNRLLISGFFTGAAMFQLSQEKPAIELLWHRVGPDEKQTEGLHTSIAEPIILGELVYGVDSHGELRCLDANTGVRLWENREVLPQKRWSTLRMIPNGDRVWLFTELGELAIGRLSRQGYLEKSRAQLIQPTRLQEPTRRKGVCWAYPAFANKCVFARNDEQLLCVSLEK